jgi:hypothetical protein
MLSISLSKRQKEGGVGISIVVAEGEAGERREEEEDAEDDDVQEGVEEVRRVANGNAKS